MEETKVTLNSARDKAEKSSSNSSSNSSSSSSAVKTTAEYFSELDQCLVRKLYLVFRLDFELFGYSPEPYLVL